jgi:hypothetical protein
MGAIYGQIHIAQLKKGLFQRFLPLFYNISAFSGISEHKKALQRLLKGFFQVKIYSFQPAAT